MSQYRIAIAENFNGSMKVEAFYTKHASFMTIICSQGEKIISESVLPIAFIPILNDLFGDLTDSKGVYRVV